MATGSRKIGGFECDLRGGRMVQAEVGMGTRGGRREKGFMSGRLGHRWGVSSH